MLPLTLLFAGPALELEPLSVPTAHHGEKMRIERFRVPAAGIEETSPRVIKKCVDGADVSDRLPLTLAVVELRAAEDADAVQRCEGDHRGRRC